MKRSRSDALLVCHHYDFGRGPVRVCVLGPAGGISEADFVSGQARPVLRLSFAESSTKTKKRVILSPMTK
ncbi:hypothetical protein MPLB_1820043 [Mesorhizobium sp. ORS 3324]|nr:hypothetical protein MPLB_1820043 [Mesorhizobium sp. ORS 3324]